MEHLKIQAISKREASKHKPTKPTLLISIQDGEKQELPFKQKTNHITRSRYIDTLFLYFDDIDFNRLGLNFSHPFAFTSADARIIIKFLDIHYADPKFDNILIHCQAGVSRSQALALFIAKYYEKDIDLFNEINNQKGKIKGGNLYIYETLEKEFLHRGN